MPNDDPQDGFFYPNLTHMMDSYNLINVILPRLSCYSDLIVLCRISAYSLARLTNAVFNGEQEIECIICVRM